METKLPSIDPNNKIALLGKGEGIRPIHLQANSLGISTGCHDEVEFETTTISVVDNVDPGINGFRLNLCKRLNSQAPISGILTPVVVDDSWKRFNTF